MAPGPAQPPDDGRSPKPGQNGFTFNRYGARVPALLVSPYIPPGIVRPPEDVPFDHTSVIKTVRERFVPAAPALTKRDAVAPSLASCLTLGPGHLNLGPGQLAMPLYVPPPGVVQAAAHAPMTGLQRALLHGIAALPPRDHALEFLEFLRTGVKPAVAPLAHTTPAEARPYLKSKLAVLLGRDEGE